MTDWETLRSEEDRAYAKRRHDPHSADTKRHERALQRAELGDYEDGGDEL